MNIVDIKLYDLKLYGFLIIPLNDEHILFISPDLGEIYDIIFSYFNQNNYKIKNFVINNQFSYSKSMKHLKVPIIIKFTDENDLNRFILENS